MKAKGCITVLKAFIDDSGSGGDSPWYVLAGYLGTIAGWDSFDDQWTDVLRQHPRIAYFKSSEAERLSCHGQWAGVSEEARNAKIDALIAVIGRFARRAICVRMKQRDYDDLVKGAIPPVWDSPYYFLQTFVIGAAINIERIDGVCESIDFVFDRDQKHGKRSQEKLLPALMPMHSLYGSLVNVDYRSEQDALPLQAADLVAWQIRRFFSVKEPRRKHFDDAQWAPPRDPHTFVMDRRITKRIITEIRQEAVRRAPFLGRSSDVRTWT